MTALNQQQLQHMARAIAARQVSGTHPTSRPERISSVLSRGASGEIMLRHGNPSNVNRDPDVLRYVCVICNQVQEPMQFGSAYIRRRCVCELDAVAAQHKQELSERVQQSHLEDIRADVYDWLGPQAEEIGLSGMSFANFERHSQITPEQLTAHATCQAFAAHHIRGQHWLENLLVFGNQAGTGKTHLACAILNTVAEAGQAARFCTAQGFFNALYAANFNDKDALLYQASTTPLLVLDDLDKLHVKDGGTFQRDTLFELLDKRYKRSLPTIFTTNEEADFSLWLAKPTLSRLYERLTLLPMSGIDYRLLRAARSATRQK